MKKFKLFLDFSTLLLISGLLFLFFFKENEEIIPESSNILQSLIGINLTVNQKC